MNPSGQNSGLDLKYTNRRVSIASRFCDVVWDFVEETGDSVNKIRWDTKLSDGTPLCHYPKIVYILRLYFEALLSGRVISGRTPKIATVVGNQFYALKAFVDFLVNHQGKQTFATVLASDHDAYLRYLRRTAKDGVGVQRLSVALYFWSADVRLGLELPIGEKPPFAGVSPHKLIGIASPEKRPKQTVVIPDSVLWPLFDTCLSYVRDCSPYLLAVKRRLDAFEAEMQKYPMNARRRRPSAPADLHNLFYRGRRFTNPAFPSARFGRLIEGLALPSSKLLPLAPRDLTDLREALDALLTACYILLGLVTGMRREELGSIEEGCLSFSKTFTGESIAWISATLKKGTKNNRGVLQKWICGEYGVLVVTVLEELTAAQRAAKSSRRLFCCLRRTWFLAKRFNHKLAKLEWSVYFANFVRHFGLVHTDSNSGCSSFWKLAPHQLRRSFIRMVVRHSDISIRALQIHCKHINAHMTDYYLGSDIELWLAFQDEVDEYKIKVYARALGEEHLAGGGGKRCVKEINEAIESGRIPANFRGQAGEQVRMRWAERALRGGKQLHILSTNFCDFVSDQALCNKGGSEPIAQLCSTACTCSTISSMHGPAWMLVAKQCKTSLETHKNSTILRGPLMQQLGQANKILSDLGVPRP